MTVEPRRLVPLAQVADVTVSIAFYARLGFEVSDLFASEEDPGLLWATLRCDGIALMVERADAPVQPRDRTALFYLYFDDIVATREALREQGLDVGPLRRRAYCPQGECRLEDPDGYVVMLTHT